MKKTFVLLILLITAFTFSVHAKARKSRFDSKNTKNQEVKSSHKVIYPSDTPAFSVEESLEYFSSLNLIKRSPFGVQQDVSLRASGFEDTAVYLGGIPVNDPQNGHFNLGLAVTRADIESFEVDKNKQEVNFTLRKPESSPGVIQVGGGQHQLREGLVSYVFPVEDVVSRVSAEYKRASGSRSDTDFVVSTISCHAVQELDSREFELISGYNKKDFGADSFYSQAFSQEEAHTSQTFVAVKEKSKGSYFNLTNTGYYRRHADEFILNRHDPFFLINHHTNYVYGLSNKFDLDNDAFLELLTEHQKVTSTTVDSRRRLKRGGSFGLRNRQAEQFIYNFNAGIHFVDGFDYLESYGAAIGYALAEDSKLNLSFDRIWRLPTFTEMYYTDAYDIGNDQLDVQHTNNYELSLDHSMGKSLAFSAALFHRKQKDSVDWVKSNSSDPWQAINFGDYKVTGLDLGFSQSFERNFLNFLSLTYTFQEVATTGQYNFSKYLFDYDRHKLAGICKTQVLKDTNLILGISLSKPDTRKYYQIFDIGLESLISSILIDLKISNVLDKSYQESGCITGQPRWIKAGLAWVF